MVSKALATDSADGERLGGLTVLEALHTLLEYKTKPFGPSTDERACEAHVGPYKAVVHSRPGESENRLDEGGMGLVELGDDVGEGLEPDAKLTGGWRGRGGG